MIKLCSFNSIAGVHVHRCRVVLPVTEQLLLVENLQPAKGELTRMFVRESKSEMIYFSPIKNYLPNVLLGSV